MQLGNQFQLVGHLQLAVASEQVADGDIVGAPHGFACGLGEPFVHEEAGTLVGEDNGHSRQVRTVFLQHVFSHVC